MATEITGTNGADVLTGTNRAAGVQWYDPSGHDNINGLDGDDRIISTTGSDTIDGGSGYDILDFSNVQQTSQLDVTGTFIDGERFVRVGTTPGSPPYRSYFTNVEKVIANPTQSNVIYEYRRNFSPSYISDSGLRVDIDLAKGQLKTFDLTTGAPVTSIVFENFHNVSVGTVGRIIGNDKDNAISTTLVNPGAVVVASKGNDSIFSYEIDYSGLDRGIKLSFTDFRIFGSNYNATVDKGDFGKDSIYGMTKIVGTAGKVNTVDASSLDYYGYGVNLNLAKNSMSIISGNKLPTMELVNFRNATGTKNNDIIVGANVNGKPNGGGGNDTITGGTKNDVIIGSSSVAKGIGEVDTLTGGGGSNKFLLGGSRGVFYVGNGANDYAKITDFNIATDAIYLGNIGDYSMAISGTNTIDIYAGKDVSTRDLVAKVQLKLTSTGIAPAARSGIMPLATDSSSLNPLLSQLNIVTTGNTEPLA